MAGCRNFARLGPKRVAVSQRVLSNALALNVGAVAAIASYLAHSVVDFNLHIPANVLLMAFVFGIVANDGVLRETESSALTASKNLWRIALPVLGLVLMCKACVSCRANIIPRGRAWQCAMGSRGFGIRYASRGLKYDPQNPDLHYRLANARTQFGDNGRSCGRRLFPESSHSRVGKGARARATGGNLRTRIGQRARLGREIC